MHGHHKNTPPAGALCRPSLQFHPWSLFLAFSISLWSPLNPSQLQISTSLPQHFGNYFLKASWCLEHTFTTGNKNMAWISWQISTSPTVVSKRFVESVRCRRAQKLRVLLPPAVQTGLLPLVELKGVSIESGDKMVIIDIQRMRPSIFHM